MVIDTQRTMLQHIQQHTFQVDAFDKMSDKMSRVPQSDQMRASGSGRRKVRLPPGRSQLDWVRNSTRFPYLRPHPVSIQELRNHRTRENAWTAINGKVFDITPYLEYHPGGIDMIMAGAGKDATKLFYKYHAWVNPDFMLARCYVGNLTWTDGDSDSNDSESDNDNDQGINNEGTQVEGPSTATNTALVTPFLENQTSNGKASQAKGETTTPGGDNGDGPTVTQDLDALRLAETAE